ncbi:zinc finger, AN1-type domain [Coemansia brasiliensis]|uniref:Zinc finger, AN1-type domain n=1 Tax=Coemansia brasiliensis TaxID=2650707 RepID=A0A9W8IJB3_9FUNG|nr:zinc finger, AN1-type domain [Coemansia brasiliensis]
MEFPELGEQCNLKDCRALDFLPFTCQYCKKRFCDEHWKVDKHNCARKDLVVDRRVPSCPICEQVISMGPNEDPDVVVDRHISRGCPQKQPKAKQRTKVTECTFKRCTKKSLVIDVCPSCRQKFCITHLHADVHECSRRAASAPVNGRSNNDVLNIFGSKRTATASSTPGRGRPTPGTSSQAKPKSKDSGCICS